MNSTPIQILQQHWKHESFRPSQEDIINSVLENQDTFALLPTGGGKSICFQVPAMVMEGICIVISPLVALMQDQVEGLKNKGIKAIALPSGIKYQELDTLLDNCIYGDYKFLYLSPERLQQDIVQDRIKQMKVNLIAVDEAHCISQWGNDFRPSYLKINLLRTLHPTVPIIALTATARTKVVDDIIQQLDLFQPQVFKKSFFRSNLAYHTIESEDKNYKIFQLLDKHEGASIIYVRNRKACVAISSALNINGYTSTFYHGGVSAEDKAKRYKQWYNDEVRVMVATNAFGMGIDKPNVRMVIHYSVPENIESYFQEAGRAGRDGKAATAFMLKNQNDIYKLTNQFIKTLPTSALVKHVYNKICNYFQISYGEGQQTKHHFDFNGFCKTYQLHGTSTYNVLKFLDRCGILRFEQHYHKTTSLQVLTNSNQLIEYIHQNSKYQLVIKAILRTYSGIFDDETKINTFLIATKTNLNETEIIKQLHELHDNGILIFEHITADAELVFLVPREDERTINPIKHYLKEQNKAKIDEVKAMLYFIQDHNYCKSVLLLRYFGENRKETCGICSHCLKNTQKTKQPLEFIKNKIIDVLKQKEQSSRELMLHFIDMEENNVLYVLKELITHQVISLNHNNKYQLSK